VPQIGGRAKTEWSTEVKVSEAIAALAEQGALRFR